MAEVEQTGFFRGGRYLSAVEVVAELDADLRALRAAALAVVEDVGWNANYNGFRLVLASRINALAAAAAAAPVEEPT